MPMRQVRITNGPTGGRRAADGCLKIEIQSVPWSTNWKYPARRRSDSCVWGVRYDRKSFTNVVILIAGGISMSFEDAGRSNMAALNWKWRDFRLWGVCYDRKSFANVVIFTAGWISLPFGSDGGSKVAALKQKWPAIGISFFGVVRTPIAPRTTGHLERA